LGIPFATSSYKVIKPLAGIVSKLARAEGYFNTPSSDYQGFFKENPDKRGITGPIC